MNTRTTTRSLAAAALAGGFTLALGLSSPASAVPWFGDRELSPGHQCQQAPHTMITTPDGEQAPSIDGIHPGLRCGQLFGKGHAYGLTKTTEGSDDQTSGDADEPTAPTAPTEPTDSPTLETGQAPSVDDSATDDESTDTPETEDSTDDTADDTADDETSTESEDGDYSFSDTGDEGHPAAGSASHSRGNSHGHSARRGHGHGHGR